MVEPADRPLPGALPWEQCVKPEPAPRPRGLLALALAESVRQRVEHICLFAGRFEDRVFSADDGARLLREHGVRLSLIRGDGCEPRGDALAQLAQATGGVVERLAPAADVDRVVLRLARCIG